MKTVYNEMARIEDSLMLTTLCTLVPKALMISLHNYKRTRTCHEHENAHKGGLTMRRCSLRDRFAILKSA